jgi:hypothetical protein
MCRIYRQLCSTRDAKGKCLEGEMADEMVHSRNMAPCWLRFELPLSDGIGSHI